MNYIEHNGKSYLKIGSGSPLVDMSGHPITKNVQPQLMAGMRKTAADNIQMPPEIRNPLLSAINFYLPYSQKVLNQWIRYYDRLHPMVGNCIDLHGSFPISKFELTLEHEDPSVLEVYENCVEEIDLFQRFLEMSREYELIGEIYPVLTWNDEYNFWDSLTLLNPDYIHTRPRT